VINICFVSEIMRRSRWETKLNIRKGSEEKEKHVTVVNRLGHA
jgi:hypothetical protein